MSLRIGTTPTTPPVQRDAAPPPTTGPAKNRSSPADGYDVRPLSQAAPRVVPPQPESAPSLRRTVTPSELQFGVSLTGPKREIPRAEDLVRLDGPSRRGS